MTQTSPTPFAHSAARPVRAPCGSTLTCANWLIEAAYRMLQNNLDPEVPENPDGLTTRVLFPPMCAHCFAVASGRFAGSR